VATKHQAMMLVNSGIRPALQRLNLWTAAAEELLLGTAIVESDLIHRRQFGPGPARGLFQMEPRTHNDIWANFLKYKPALAQAVGSLLSSQNSDRLVELERNDRYASAMARVHYLRVSVALPRAGDVLAMAAYWKDHYNTWKGKGKKEKYVAKWHQTMGSQG